MAEKLGSESEQRRMELAQFLRNRRARVDPAAVGFPVGDRRRTGGLRREEVAVLAGVSPTWYTYLEQGRRIQPSPEVLDSLASVLKLDEDERRYIHSLAYGYVVNPQPLTVGMSSDDMLREIVKVSQHDEYPVYSVDRYCDLISWNRAAETWYDDWGLLPAGERNMLRWMLLSPQARKRLPDWEEDTQDIVARWRAEIARWQGDRRLGAMVTEFSRLSPEFVRWWDGHDVREHRSRIRRFEHPQYGVRDLRLVVMSSPDSNSSIVVFHLPVFG